WRTKPTPRRPEYWNAGRPRALRRGRWVAVASRRRRDGEIVVPAPGSRRGSSGPRPPTRRGPENRGESNGQCANRRSRDGRRHVNSPTYDLRLPLTDGAARLPWRGGGDELPANDVLRAARAVAGRPGAFL